MIRPQARELVDQLPPQATWDDLMREIYVRQAIEQGLADSEVATWPVRLGPRLETWANPPLPRARRRKGTSGVPGSFMVAVNHCRAQATSRVWRGLAKDD